MRPSRFVNTSNLVISRFVQFINMPRGNNVVAFRFNYFNYTSQAWPANAKVEAWKMAKAGLRYTGQEEEVHIRMKLNLI